MDIFGRCNGPGGGTSLTGSGLGAGGLLSGVGRVVVGTGTGTGTITSTGTGNGNDTTVAESAGGRHGAVGPGSGGGGAGNGTGAARMQLTGASAPGAAASPESGVSPLADAYTKMTSDILTERTLGDFVSEHPGELVKTGETLIN